MKIQTHFSISFHFKLFYKDSICDTHQKNKYGFKKKNENLSLNVGMTIFETYFQKTLFQLVFVRLMFFSSNIYICQRSIYLEFCFSKLC
jgi:hypothetical protein